MRICRSAIEQKIPEAGGTVVWRDWRKHPLGLSGLGQYQSGLPISFPLASERSADSRGRFEATGNRVRSCQSPILALHDTTEFSFRRDDKAAVGILCKNPVRNKRDGTPQHTIVCGVLMHSSLAITTDGLPLGLTAIKFWSRDQFYGCNALKKRVNHKPASLSKATKAIAGWRICVNPLRSSMIRSTASISAIVKVISTSFFVWHSRSGHIFCYVPAWTRLAGDGKHTVADEMSAAPACGLHRIQVGNDKGEKSEAVLEIRFRRIRLLPPIGKQKEYPELRLTVIHAQERGNPHERERIDWKLITDLPVTSRHDALQKIRWYSLRWKIETFHKILKSGCCAETSKLRTASRLVNFIAILCILGWRIFWLAMANRSMPNAAPHPAFTGLEVTLLDKVVKDKTEGRRRRKPLSTYINKLARLGGYLARAHDPPPGNMLLWRGLSRLTNIQIGFLLGAQLVGN